MFDGKSFCHKYSIEYANSGKHFRRGWTNICCPHCLSDDYKLGINNEKGYSTCYSCGFHSLKQTIAKLLNIPYSTANEIIIEFSEGFIKEDALKIKPSTIELPIGLGPLKEQHYNYIKGRNYKASVARFFKLKGTSIHGNYPHRIFIPVYQDHELVNFQCRDITGRSKIKYKTCPNDNSKIDLKNTLYNLDSVKGKSVIIVEGALDAWRFPNHAVATFGTEFTNMQARLISNKFDKIFIMFDPDEYAAQGHARNLFNFLSVLNKDVEIINLNTGTDPGDLTDKQADEILGDLGIVK